MANEITQRFGLRVSKNAATIDVTTVSKQITMSGDAMIQSVQAIGLAAETIDLGDITLPGYVLLKNLGPDTITVDDDDTPTLIPLAVGEGAVFPVANVTLYAIASATASNLMIAACEA